MAPLAPLFEFQMHPTRDSLEAPLGKNSFALEALAARCDDGSAYGWALRTIRGKERQLYIPKRELDPVQRRINQVLYPIDLSFGTAPHGFIARRSILSNARPHCGANYLHKFDIKDFFSNVTTQHAEAALSLLGFGKQAASLLARLTSCRGALPLGARTSPRISNMVLLGFDEEMEDLARDKGLTYTRYADDLSFSSASDFEIGDFVEEALRIRGFVLNSTKTKSFKRGQPMFVTGLSVADSKYPRLRKRLKTRLRQEFYFIEKYGLDEHCNFIEEPRLIAASRLSGQYHYALTVEPDFAADLAGQFPNARAAVAPQHDDSRAERAQRHRREFVAKVLKAPGRSLPFYQPFVPLVSQ